MAFNKATYTNLLETVIGCKTPETILEQCQDASEKGHIYEAMWRLAAIFNVLPEDRHKNILFMTGNSNKRLTRIQDYESEFFAKRCKQGKASGFSDLSFLTEDNKLFVASSKYYSYDAKLEEYGLSELVVLKDKNRDLYKQVRFIMMVRDKGEFLTTLKASDNGHVYEQDLDHVYDLVDLAQAMAGVLYICHLHNNDLSKIKAFLQAADQHPIMTPRFHQKLAVTTSIRLMENGSAPQLWGMIPRSGKSYIIASHIAQCMKETQNKKRFLIITPVPRETVSQFKDGIFHKYQEFKDVDFIKLRQGVSLPQSLDKPLIAMASKQYLQRAANLGKLHADGAFDVIYFDEAHYSGCTDISRNIIRCLSDHKTQHIFVTATYHKPHLEWHVPEDHIIRWDLDDVEACKRGDTQYLADKFGSDTVSRCLVNADDLQKTYAIHPRLCLFTAIHDGNAFKEKFGDDSGMGYDVSKMFAVQSQEHGFIHRESLLDLVDFIVGNPAKKVFKPEVFYKIKSHAQKYGGRTLRSFHSQLWFLPSGTTDKLCKNVIPCFKDLLLEHEEASKYHIVSLYDDTEMDIGAFVEEEEIKAQANDKKGVIILTGERAAMGVSLPNVDIVVMLNGDRSADLVYQKMFRCMTETKSNDNKPFGYVVDLHAQRVLQTVLSYGGAKLRDFGTRDKLIKVMDFIDIQDVGLKIEEKAELINRLMEIWRSDYKLRQEMLNARFNEIDMLPISKHILRDLLGTISVTKNGKPIKMDVNDEVHKVPDAKSHNMYGDEDKAACKQKTKAVDTEDSLKYGQELIPSIVRLLAFLTFDVDLPSVGLTSMLEYMDMDEQMREVFLDQCNTWWQLKHPDTFVERIKWIVQNLVLNHEQVNKIVSYIRESMKYDVKDRRGVLTFVNAMMKPKEIEKKLYGEVFTPIWLVEQMLDKLPKKLWKNPNLKWFDPCVGIGNFMICVYHRLMEGLKEVIPNEDLRSEHILTKMLYMSELNKKNVYICKKMFGKGANISRGDTLELDPTKKWGVDRFDVIVGNPPYQPSSNGKKGGKSLWPAFVKYAFEHLWQDGYLCFVHPALWRKPGNELHDLMFNKKFLYLSIHSKQDGDKVFKATTRYDWYVIQNKTVHNQKFSVRFEDDVQQEIELTNEMPCIPNFGWTVFVKCYAMSKKAGGLPAIRSSECHTQREYVSAKKDAVHKYPIINAISQTHGVRFVYSSKPHSDQYAKKVIFSNGEIINPIYDDGKYGTSEGGIYIKVNSDKDGHRLVEYLNSKVVKYLIRCTKWSNFETVKEVFHYIPDPAGIKYPSRDSEVYKYIQLTPDDVKAIERK